MTIQTATFWIATSLSLLAMTSGVAVAAINIPFTINLSEAVTVTGTPRIAVDVGGNTRYATYTSGSGTNALIFTLIPVSGDVDLDGITLSSSIDLNGGTIKDPAGNNASLTFTPPDTSGITINAAIPSGYSVGFAAKTVTNSNKTALSFSLTYPKANKTLHYTISSSGGGTPITGTLPTLAGTTTVNSLNVTTLPDGLLTLSAYLTDSLGGTGVTVTDTIPMAVLDNSLVGHWTFDTTDISGTTLYDRSGQGNNGVINSAMTPSPGKIGSALDFNAVANSNVAIPDSNSLDIPNTLTISTWIKPVADVVGYALQPIRKWTGTADANYVVYYFGTTSPYNRAIGVYGNRGGTWNSLTGSYIASLGAWIHVGATYDSSTGGKLYINGTQVSNIPASGTLITNNIPLNLGAFPGVLDDVRIYNRILTPAEMTTLASTH